jgi:sugar phosphate isomerase/epimerase
MLIRSTIFAALALAVLPAQADPHWKHLSSTTGDLPVPGPSTQQTGAIVADLDKDGTNDFVLSFRHVAPALVWYRRTATGWDRYVIDPDFLTVEAGGAVLDINGDGNPDIVFGGDWQSSEVWWWENPYPNFDPKVPWKRHLIKKGGATQHHDQAFGDFLGKGKPQLAFWNQGAKKIFLAEIPQNPEKAETWPLTEIFSGEAGEGHNTAFKYAEGTVAADIDNDGQVDLLAGNLWFKHRGGMKFDPIQIGSIGGRIAVGRFKPGKYPQVVIAPGDGIGPLRWYECVGNPEKTADWVGHDLLDRDMIHGHSLQVADIDGDGNLDIFTAEMAKWTESQDHPDNPNATAWIFYGDGKGNFRKTVFSVGVGFHEARVADLNGDGKMDILDKPYNWEVPRVDVWLQVPATDHAFNGDRESMEISDRPLGLELYSFRREMAKDVAGTLSRVRDFGFQEVEVPGLYGLSAEKFREELDKTHLRCTAMVAQYDELGARMDSVIRDAKALGAEYVICPWIPHGGKFTAGDAQKGAENFNRWGAALGAAGLQFCYHPHGYEFQPAADGTLFDTLVSKTDPKNVNFEMDVFWIVHPGQNPVALLEKYPTRFPLMHLKDLAKSAHGDLSGSAPEESSVALGAGQVDWAAVLAAARRASVKRYYIEDEAATAMRQVDDSLKYLRGLRY